MGFREEMNKELARIHADARTRVIINKIAGEIEDMKGEHAEIKERITNIEEKNA